MSIQYLTQVHNDHLEHVRQASRFVIVGLLNTAIDFAILNALIFTFSLEREGYLFIVFKSIAFLFAAANSFLLNKNWVFEEHRANHGKPLRSQIYKFVSVSTFSLIINVAVSSIVFAIGSSIYKDSSPELLANVGALIGVGAVLLTNFFGYKNFVFKK